MRSSLSWREEKFYVSKLGRGKGITYNAEVSEIPQTLTPPVFTW